MSPTFRKSTPSSLVAEPELGKPPDSRLKSNLRSSYERRNRQNMSRLDLKKQNASCNVTLTQGVRQT